MAPPYIGQPREYGIRAILPHAKSRMLFPRQCQDGLLISGYRGDRKNQQKLWRPVREKILAWQEFHRNRSKRKPPLYYCDGGTYLIIHQELPGKTALLHRLRSVSRKIYLFCNQPKSITEICTAFPGLNREEIETFVCSLGAKKLMFQESDRVLALAVGIT